MNFEGLKEKATKKIEKYDKLMSMYKHPSMQYALSLAKNVNLDLLNDLDNLEYNRKVKIPQFVAEYIERCKRSDCGLIWAIRPDRDANANSEQVYDWLFPNGVKLSDGTFPKPFEPDNLVRPDKENQVKFARAWLDGYEVEEEPKYYVVLPSGQHLTKDSKANEYLFVFDTGQAVELTEDEIKGISKDYQPFAVPVEEVNHE